MAERRAKRLTIAIDTGGTFTDCVYRDGGRIEVLKLPSTPDDPGRAILEGVAQIAARVGATEIEVRHGTTVDTNASVWRSGWLRMARCGVRRRERIWPSCGFVWRSRERSRWRCRCCFRLHIQNT